MGWAIGLLGIFVAWIWGMYVVRNYDKKLNDLAHQGRQERNLTDRIEALMAKRDKEKGPGLNEQEKRQLDNMMDERLVLRWKIEYLSERKE